MVHAIRISVLIILILFFMFLPFMPGKYDGLAIPLSLMVQIFSYASLLLLPIGIVWLVFELMIRVSGTKFFMHATLIVSGIIAVIVASCALSNRNFLLGIIFLIVSLLLLFRVYLRLRNGSLSFSQKYNTLPIYLVAVPLLAASVRFILITPAVEFSRHRAIRNSKELIEDIESFHKKNGFYPASLQAIHTGSDYPPSVIGISEYFYEPSGTTYNLYFRQFSDELYVSEIVMYNKNDEHRFTAHAMDILEFTGDELALRRGDQRRYKLSSPHWIYIKFY